MKLSEKQQLFTVMIANLIHFAEEKGYRLTFGEAYRTPEQAALNAKKGAALLTACIPSAWRWILTCLLMASTRPTAPPIAPWANTGNLSADRGGAVSVSRTGTISVLSITGFADAQFAGSFADSGRCNVSGLAGA